MKRFLTAFLLVVFSAAVAMAQGTFGRLSGTVSGPDGALPGATVTATDASTGKEYTVTTNEEGFYNFPQLEFGTYTIRVTASGFKTLIANEQKIDVGREATLNPVLEIGDVSAEVVVTAGADIVPGGSFAQASYRMSLLALLRDADADGMREAGEGPIADFLRMPVDVRFSEQLQPVEDDNVAAITVGEVVPRPADPI